MSDFMMTYAGLKLNPMEITAADISLKDIAHALSLLCRGCGHTKYFYSVGQHSINCAKEAKARGWSRRVVLACLIHDGSEAYLSDIIRPVKKYLPTYKQIEEKVMTVIYEKVGLGELTESEWRQMRQIDDDILAYELVHLLGAEREALPQLHSEPDFSEMDWKIVEEKFTQIYREAAE